MMSNVTSYDQFQQHRQRRQKQISDRRKVTPGGVEAVPEAEEHANNVKEVAVAVANAYRPTHLNPSPVSDPE
jgi:hypothetical protein